jgi:hypothetical protein
MTDEKQHGTGEGKEERLERIRGGVSRLEDVRFRKLDGGCSIPIGYPF